MKIRKVEIKNFKGIEDLSIKAKSINIIIGRNNTCKTSLLEAISYATSENMRRFELEYEHRLNSLINVGSAESEVLIDLDDGNKRLRLSKPELVHILGQLKEDFKEFAEWSKKSQRFFQNPFQKKKGIIEDFDKILSDISKDDGLSEELHSD